MITEREDYINRSILRLLAACGSYPMPEAALRDQLGLRLAPPPRTSELDAALRYLESLRRISAIESETARLWRLTDTGRSWWEEYRF